MGLKHKKTRRNIENIWIHTNLNHIFRYSANQHLIVINLYSDSINKSLVTDFMTVRVSQNLSLM